MALPLLAWAGKGRKFCETGLSTDLNLRWYLSRVIDRLLPPYRSLYRTVKSNLYFLRSCTRYSQRNSWKYNGTLNSRKQWIL